ncbi:MAG: DoxX family protein, partial [Schleiferiaceae bacterium]|nr:DoxX family protein [Schleiferiaceae bacterium]
MKFITQISRVFVGVLFIFSGMIKLNDPLGFSFKLEEYFSAAVLNIPFLEPLALEMAVFVVILEVLLGVALLIGYKPKLTVWLLFLMIIFFTFLTFYSAYYNKVTDCGCFGDAIPLTPWESFGKDVILTILIVILMAGLKYIQPVFKAKINGGLILGSLLFCSWFGFHVLNHLPVKDFRAYAKGKSIVEGMMSAEELGKEPPQYQVVYVLKNEATGETIKVNDKDYLGQEWWKKKEWVIESGVTETKLVKEGYEPPVHDFSILTEAGDVTEEILGLERAIMVISYDLEKSNKEGFKKIAEFGWKADEAGIPIICMTSTE